MNRKIFYWKLRATELQLGERTLLMGVLNVTPDSFSDGGAFTDPDRAYARAMEMEEQGVDLIDIGAESTRPDSKRISADEEWQRLVPVLKRLRDKVRVPISLDTYKSEIAQRALDYGIEIINDPSGLTFDADLAKIAAEGNTGLILNHMRGLPETWTRQAPMPDVMGGISKDLEATASRARRMGVDKSRIVLDPGIGFGKRKEQNSEILAQLGRLASLEYPILVGPSRKSFLMEAVDGDTLHATAAAVTAAILNGANIVRVHDVKEMRVVARVADEIARAVDTQPKVAPEAAERPVRRAPRAEFQDEKPKPTRPPLSRPALPPQERKEPFAPAARQNAGDRPVFRRPPQDRQDRPARSGPPRDREERRPFRGAAPGGKPRNDRFRDDQRGEKRPFSPRREGDRPPFRGKNDRPPRGDAGDRPRGPSQGRPPQGRPSPGGRPQGGPPRRPFRKRP